MNIVNNFSPISGANDDNVLVLTSDRSISMAQRRVLIDNTSAPRTLKYGDVKTVVFSILKDGSKSELFSIGKNDLPSGMRDNDECGQEWCEILKEKMFNISVFSNIRYEGAYSSYKHSLYFEHFSDIVVEIGDMSEYITYYDGNFRRSPIITDKADYLGETSYTLTIQSADGIRAISQKKGSELVMFNLRHIVGGTYKKVVELDMQLTEKTASAIREINVTTPVIILPNAVSLKHNLRLNDVMWLSDRVGDATRHNKKDDIYLTLLYMNGWSNANTILQSFYDKDGNYIDGSYYTPRIYNQTSNKVVTMLLDKDAWLHDYPDAYRTTVQACDEQGTEIGDVIDIELIDHCTISDTPNMLYLNEFGGIDCFNLFDTKSTSKKSGDAITYQGLFKGQRGTAYKTFSYTTEFKTMLLDHSEFKMASNLIHSSQVTINDSEVIVSKADTTWADQDTAKTLSITIDDLI